MKWLGSLLICWGGLLCWRQQVTARRRQEETLQHLLTAALRLREGVRQARVPLPVLLQQLAELPGAAGCFFHKVLAAEEDLPGAWRQNAADLPLPRESLEAWCWLGEELRGDETHVIEAVFRAEQVLSQERQRLADNRREAARQSGAICFSAAALLVILLV